MTGSARIPLAALRARFLHAVTSVVGIGLIILPVVAFSGEAMARDYITDESIAGPALREAIDRVGMNRFIEGHVLEILVRDQLADSDGFICLLETNRSHPVRDIVCRSGLPGRPIQIQVKAGTSATYIRDICQRLLVGRYKGTRMVLADDTYDLAMARCPMTMKALADRGMAERAGVSTKRIRELVRAVAVDGVREARAALNLPRIRWPALKAFRPAMMRPCFGPTCIAMMTLSALNEKSWSACGLRRLQNEAEHLVEPVLTRGAGYVWENGGETAFTVFHNLYDGSLAQAAAATMDAAEGKFHAKAAEILSGSLIDRAYKGFNDGVALTCDTVHDRSLLYFNRILMGGSDD